MPGVLSFNRFGALLTATMLTSLVIVLGGSIQRFIPQWQPLYLAVSCFVIALETTFVSFTVRRDRMWMNESMRYLVAEVAVLLIVMRVVATLSFGAATLAEDARLWLLYPLSAIADGPFIGCFLVALLVAVASHGAVRDLLDLAPQEFEGRVQPRDEHLHVHTLANRDRADALRRINQRFIVGGVLLLGALSVQVVNVQVLTGAALSVAPFSAVSALVYVIAGFLFYSQARLALLQSRWTIEHAVVDSGIARRWTRNSALLIGGLALAMLALPRTYGMGLIDTFRTTMGFMGGLIIQLGYILLWLMGLITMVPLLLLSWLLPGPDAAAPPAPPLPPPMPPPTAPVEGAPPLLPSLIFWACMLFLAGYALWIVLQRHPGLRALLTLRGPFATFRRWLAGTWLDASQWAQQVAQSVARQLTRSSRAARPRWPALRLAKLAPRELVRYFYLSTIQRATKQGIGRKVGQTPYEYSAILAHTMAENQEDVAQLTDAFVTAHYSPQSPDASEVNRVRRHWERLRRQLSHVKGDDSSPVEH